MSAVGLSPASRIRLVQKSDSLVSVIGASQLRTASRVTSEQQRRTTPRQGARRLGATSGRRCRNRGRGERGYRGGAGRVASPIASGEAYAPHGEHQVITWRTAADDGGVGRANRTSHQRSHRRRFRQRVTGPGDRRLETPTANPSECIGGVDDWAVPLSRLPGTNEGARV